MYKFIDQNSHTYLQSIRHSTLSTWNVVTIKMIPAIDRVLDCAGRGKVYILSQKAAMYNTVNL